MTSPCEHRALMVFYWDFASGTMTYRCVRCGAILDRLTTREPEREAVRA